MPDDASLPLAGYTVAVTAARRKEELGALLDRRGARVVYAPAIRIVPLSDDAELVAATREVLARPVDLVIATTGVGFRGWLEAADAWDLPLVEHLQPARVLARGPKARGAIRGGGLVDAWSPESESSVEVLSHLLSGAEGPLRGTADRRPAARRPAARPGRRPAGRRRRRADRAGLPLGAARGRRPGAQAGRARSWPAAIDAVTFTSAPAAASLLAVADELGLQADAGRGAAGPGAGDRRRPGDGRARWTPSASRATSPSGPASGRWPARSSPGCPSATRCCRSARTRCRSAGYAAILDGRVVELAPGPMAVLRELARRPGHVVPRTELIGSLPGGGDGHAVEMAVTRLRAALGAPVVETVVKRGYRLAV